MNYLNFLCYYIKSRVIDLISVCFRLLYSLPENSHFQIFSPGQQLNTQMLFWFDKSDVTLPSHHSRLEIGKLHDRLTMKLLPQAFPSLMGKLNLTTGGTTVVSSVPWQSTMFQMRFRISKLSLYPVYMAGQIWIARSMADVPHTTAISVYSDHRKIALFSFFFMW